jgi:hypothetical protein
VKPVGPSEARSVGEVDWVCSAVMVSDCGGGRGPIGYPCDPEAVGV